MKARIETNELPEPAPGLDFLADLITDRQRLRPWLHDCEPAVRQPFTHGVLLVASLQIASGLRIGELLDVLGCRRRGRFEVDAMGPVALRECVAFLRWTLELTLCAPDDESVRVAVIAGLSALYADADRDIEACIRAMGEPVETHGGLSPRSLIALGEVVSATCVARASLFGLAAQGSPTLLDRHLRDPLRPIHIAPATLDALLRYANEPGDRELGVARALPLLAHLRLCSPCADAYRERSATLGLPIAR
jgi:hypothetical protein